MFKEALVPSTQLTHPLIETHRVNVDISKPQALCICPTRELVIQNLNVLRKMASRTNPPITSRATADIEPRIPGVRLPPIMEHVVIGTPGTLDNWISRRRLSLDAMRVLVFDEADQMLMTEGFMDVSFRMLSNIRKVSPDVQILLFSATFSERVREYCNKVRCAVAGQHVCTGTSLLLVVSHTIKTVPQNWHCCGELTKRVALQRSCPPPLSLPLV
jgi:superfamily II DNA/RNA helicase